MRCRGDSCATQCRVVPRSAKWGRLAPDFCAFWGHFRRPNRDIFSVRSEQSPPWHLAACGRACRSARLAARHRTDYPTARQWRPGQVASAVGQPVMTFVSNEQPIVVATFPPNALRHIRVGDLAEIAMDRHPGKILRGQVKTLVDISAQGQLSPSGDIPDWTEIAPTSRFVIRFELDEESSGLALPGGAGGCGGDLHGQGEADSHRTHGRHTDDYLAQLFLLTLHGAPESTRVSPKDLRDTFASQLLTAGVQLGCVSAQLGHADLSTTARHYAKWCGDAEYNDPMIRREGEVPADYLARLVSPQGPPTDPTTPSDLEGLLAGGLGFEPRFGQRRGLRVGRRSCARRRLRSRRACRRGWS